MADTQAKTGSRIVFWDWNGTLCDDLQVSLDAVNELLRVKELPPISLEQYYSYVDTPISRFYERLFDLNEVTMDEIAAHYRSYYNAHLPEDCLMKGVRQVLDELKERGAVQVILSSAHRVSIEERARRLGILPYFSDILAADDWMAQSKEERTRVFLSQNGCGTDTSRVWFIGDALHDADVAKACGCGDRCILLPFGHQSEEDLRKTGAVFCSDWAAIPQLIYEKDFDT
ncbi:MAG: HAD family hydrolase [Clostridia bacterium]|nr:HAD family hydrolase [Clostridia bacterium]